MKIIKLTLVFLFLTFIVFAFISYKGKSLPSFKDEVILSKSPENYMEVHHLVLRGSNEEIGKTIGEIAQKWLKIKAQKLQNIYAHANRIYHEKNYPILFERIKGIAKSYNISLNEPDSFISPLVYDVSPFACSAIYFPQSSTVNGHAYLAHNFDFFPGSLKHYLNIANSNEDRIYSRNFIIEIYPDKGYPSIGVGSLDLLNGLMSGMNSKGLTVAMLADPNCPRTENPDDIYKNSGLMDIELLRLILDTCENIQQAKIAFLNNKMIFSFLGVHFIVSDANGRSFICEIDPKTLNYRFTDNNGPQIMTNHPVYLYKNVIDFPDTEKNQPYNSFNRYKTLYYQIKNSDKKFSVDDIKNLMSNVYGHTIEEKSYKDLRTFWSIIYDKTEKTIEVKFYLHDGPVDSKNEPTLIFSNPFKFKLQD